MSEIKISEAQKAQLDFYDKVIGAYMVNTYSMSKNGRIILDNFDGGDTVHLFAFEVAKIVAAIHQDRKIYLQMNPIKFLWFKFQNRKDSKVRWISKKEAAALQEKTMMEMLEFTGAGFNQGKNECKNLFANIYNIYWNRKEIK